MSYALMWIEGLLTALLWAAGLFALAQAMRRKWQQIAIGIISLIPFPFFALLVIAARTIYFQDVRHNWFAYFLALLCVFAAGWIFLFIWARRSRIASPWSRPKVWLAYLVSAVLLCMTVWNMELDTRASAANLRVEAGTDMVAAAPPILEDSENGAVIYWRAFDRMKGNDPLDDENSPLNSKTPQDNPAAIKLLEHHAVTISLLRKAEKMPHARFDHDYAHPSMSMLLPEAGQSRRAVKLLALHARYAIAQGDIDDAAGDVATMFHLSRVIRDEPILVSVLVSAAMESTATGVLEELLSSANKREQLKDLHLEPAFGPETLQRALTGERALAMATFADEAAGSPLPIDLFQQTPGVKVSPLLNEPVASLLVRLFLVPDDLAEFRELIDNAMLRTRWSYSAQVTRSPALDDIKKSGILTALLFPAVNRFFDLTARARALHGDAMVALALTRYRLDHGKDPASLDDLVPDYLDEVPLDPFDGKPLRVVYKADETVIYSVGPDGVDYHGEKPTNERGDIRMVLRKHV